MTCNLLQERRTAIHALNTSPISAKISFSLAFSHTHRRALDPVRQRESGHRDSHPSAVQHADPVHAESAQQLHAPSAHHPCRLHVLRQRFVDPAGDYHSTISFRPSGRRNCLFCTRHDTTNNCDTVGGVHSAWRRYDGCQTYQASFPCQCRRLGKTDNVAVVGGT